MESFANRPSITNPMLWLDLETTGSNPNADCIIEIGCILTTHDLQGRPGVSAPEGAAIPSAEFTSIVKPSEAGLGRLMQNKVVREMHQKNGLLDEIVDASDEFSQDKVTKRLLSWLDHSLAPWYQLDMSAGRTVVIAGSGVGHFDMAFLRRYMPQLMQRAKYWPIDIGTIRRAYDMWDWGTTISVENDNKTHRALDDARCHLREARAFKAHWNAQSSKS